MTRPSAAQASNCAGVRSDGRDGKAFAERGGRQDRDRTGPCQDQKILVSRKQAISPRRQRQFQ